VQNVAQLRAKGFDDDVVTSQVQAAHTGAGATLKRLPGINWLKEEVGAVWWCIKGKPSTCL
jgi:hypothetical protein